MEPMPTHKRYPPELKEWAARMESEWRQERDRADGGYEEVAAKLGVHPESVRNWLKTQQSMLESCRE